jgi:predicted nuclease with TOPRIM domain
MYLNCGRFFSLLLIFAPLSQMACVPKAQFEDQQAKILALESALKTVEEGSLECNPSALIELREQAQSLDILTQEFLNRNTELSEEVARLRVYEAQVKNSNLQCDERLNSLRQDYESRLSRTRKTFEDLVSELRKEISELNAKVQSGEAPKSPKKP